MKEYIERAVALEALSKSGVTCNMRAHKIVASIQAADVAQVRHGRWIPSDMGGGEPDEAYICSECEEPWTLIAGTPEENNMRYCPACGARMDKEDEHEAD